MGVVKPSEGALPLHLEDIVEGDIMVFDRREIRVWEFEERESERE